jgi:hypothetical protein
MTMVLVVVHSRVGIVDAIPVVHLAICNNNGNKALSTKGIQLDLPVLD